MWPLISPFYIDYPPDYRNTIFLAGTEKSGTTWVSDIINYNNRYRYIFEPFWADKVDICRNFKPRLYIRPDNNDNYFITTAEFILSGRIRNRWTDRYHKKFLAKKRLIKDIRANLFLKWIHHHFPEIPIILLLRHPCAVARSHLRRTHLQQDLTEFLNQEELMNDFLNPFKEEIKKAQTKFEKIIFRWCIENYVPLRQFQPGDIHVAFYENFCEIPRTEIDGVMSYLGVKYDNQIFERLREPSPVSRKDSAIILGASLIDFWRKDITHNQLEKAIKILALFGMDKIYSTDSMPNIDGPYEIMRSP